jgi:hypothetical protein
VEACALILFNVSWKRSRKSHMGTAEATPAKQTNTE